MKKYFANVHRSLKSNGLFICDVFGGSQCQDAIVDVTIVYPGGVPTFMDLMTGRIGEIIVNVQQRPIPKELLVDAQGRAADRATLQRWINGLWVEKDSEISQIKAAAPKAR
mgnify:CR=1 FL=1